MSDILESGGPQYDLEIDADDLLAELAEDSAEYGRDYEEKSRWWLESLDDHVPFHDARYWMLEARGGQRAYCNAMSQLQPGGRYRNQDGSVDVRGFMRYLSRWSDDAHKRSSGPYPETRQADEAESAYVSILSTVRDEFGVGWPRLDDLGGNALECDLP